VGTIWWLGQATPWIDGLKGPQILAWIGIALAAYLVLVLVCVLTDSPTRGVTGGVIWVSIGACAATWDQRSGTVTDNVLKADALPNRLRAPVEAVIGLLRRSPECGVCRSWATPRGQASPAPDT
jgi:hypothetical protein